MNFGKRKQSGRAHIEVVVLMTCLGTLALVTAPRDTAATAAREADQPNRVAAVSDRRPSHTQQVLSQLNGRPLAVLAANNRR